jgi:hypothetical protein
MKVTVDRFEGDFAVVELENGDFVNMHKGLLPEGVKEGGVILIEKDGEETEKRRRRISGLLEELREKPGGKNQVL